MGFCEVTFLSGKKSDVKFENFEFFSNYALVFVAYFSSFKFRVFGPVLVFGRRFVHEK